MKIRTLAAIALVAAVPAAAQANSVMTERAFEYLNKPLDTQATAEHHTLATQYRVDNVRGGHSNQENDSLAYVSAATQRLTDHKAGNNALVGNGQSDAAAAALRRVNTTQDAGQGDAGVKFADAN